MDYAEQLGRNGYLYILRRTLPPWSWRENLDELKTVCPRYGIDEVCVKIDTGTFTHYAPDEKWLYHYQKILFTIRDELAEIGVNYSLNPNVTQGHSDRGRHIDRQHPAWHMITGSDGSRATDCTCNTSPGWREYFRFQWSLYAETKPALIWIEDDFRTFNHGAILHGCFCDEHIRRFNEKLGTTYDRKEIYTRLMAPGEPDPLRSWWLEFVGEMTAEAVQWAEETVHAISPATIIGLMTSDPSLHVREGRNWFLIYDKMAGPEGCPVASRPPLGNYAEGRLTGLLTAADFCRLSRRAFEKPTLTEGEIENFPYTGYAKSNAFLELQNSIAVGSGCAALTLNLFDHCGDPMAETEDVLQALTQQKPYLTALKERLQPLGTGRGIGLYFHPEAGRSKRLGSDYNAQNLDGEALKASSHLQGLGFAVTFDPSPVMALTGQDIRRATEEEINNIFGGAVLVDATAFIALSEMGYEDLLGGRLIDSFQLNTTHPLAGEHFHYREFGGQSNRFLSLAIHQQKPRFTAIAPDTTAVEISEIVDPDCQRRFSGTYAYRNRLGGRVVVLPLEFGGLAPGFASPGRKAMMKGIFHWLTDGRIPLYLSGHRPVLPLRVDHPRYTVCGLYNLSLDELPEVTAEMHLTRPVKSVERLDLDGHWRPFADFRQIHSHGQATISKFHYREPVYLTLHHE